MIESYINLSNLMYSDSFLISSLTSCAMFQRCNNREEATKKVLWYHKNRYRFASLILCTRISFVQNLPHGPIRMLSKHQKIIDFITSKDYFLLSFDRRISLYWNEVFAILVRHFFDESSEAETLFMDLLTYLGNLEFVGKINLSPKLYQMNSVFEAQMIIQIEKDSHTVIFPTLPKFRTRESYNSKSRPESLWDESSFYRQHRDLVREVWDELESKEQAAFLKYNSETDDAKQKQ